MKQEVETIHAVLGLVTHVLNTHTNSHVPFRSNPLVSQSASQPDNSNEKNLVEPVYWPSAQIDQENIQSENSFNYIFFAVFFFFFKICFRGIFVCFDRQDSEDSDRKCGVREGGETCSTGREGTYMVRLTYRSPGSP